MKAITKYVLMFSVFILLSSGTYNSFTSLLNYIHKSHGQDHNIHAQIFFVLNSIICIIFNLIFPNINIKSLKKVSYCIPSCFLIIYFLTYVGFMIDNSIVVLIFTVLESIFAGIGSSLVWVISGRYINNLCKFYKVQNQSGKYYGILGVVMSCNFLFGAILSATSLELLQTKHNIYLLLMIVCLTNILFLKLFIQDIKQQSQNRIQLIEEQPRNNKNMNLESSFFNKQFQCNKICIFRNISIYRKMLPFYPYQILSGLISGYIFHCSQDLVFAPQNSDKDAFLTINFIFIGFGGIVGSYFSGYFSDRMKQKRIFLIATVGYLISFLMGIASLQMQMIQVSLATAFISGASMIYGNNILTVVCSKIYGGSIQAFSGNRVIINLSVIIYNIGIGFVSSQKMQENMYYEITILLIITLISLYMIRYVKQRADSAQQSKIELEKTIQLNEAQTNADSSKSTRKDQNQLK